MDRTLLIPHAPDDAVDIPTADRGAAHGLHWSPAWAVESGDDPTSLVLSAGADRRLAIDGVDPADGVEVRLWAADALLPAVLPAPGTARGRLLDRLVEIGAVVAIPTAGSTIVTAGDDAIGDRLAGLLGDHAADITVVVRTGADWPETPDDRMHLGVDLALHHTVVLGPVVIPGVSACLACLDARVAHRWGRTTVPEFPAIQRRLAVVADLVDIQLGLLAGGRSPLVNATIAWNLETGDVDRQALYKLAGCRRCAATSVTPATGTGRVALPWVDR